MRFTCRSTDSDLARLDSLAAWNARHSKKSQPATSKAPKSKGKAKAAPKRVSQATRDAKLAAVSEAKRAAKAREIAKKPLLRRPTSFVYVGNLQSGITELALQKLFAKYGPVIRVQIRCSGGQVTPQGLAIPKSARGPRDRLYATVEFDNALGAVKALELDGHVIEGIPLVVTTSAAGLPEIEDIIKSRMGTNHRAPTRSRATKRKPLNVQATEVFTNIDRSTEPPPGADKFRIFGYSFAPTVI
ncbi:hypothetical protein FA15DRAFT_664858 [Coprinopsis marcescibilis]|uniref:RRM domain-containing protein n=1 Tax=Coprinopsis marcescibilis TaxID=230819 RepID=A0A5C3L7M9_COPMA|nr:hypothetical protein FA15DRAFT_664858 [Coprinopsis marcescibilis]